MTAARCDSSNSAQPDWHRTLAEGIIAPRHGRPVGFDAKAVRGADRDLPKISEARGNNTLASTVVAPGDNGPFSSEHDVVRPACRNRDDPPRLVKLERDRSIAPRHDDACAMKLPR